MTFSGATKAKAGKAGCRGVEDGRMPIFNIQRALDMKMRSRIRQSLHRNRRREISDG